MMKNNILTKEEKKKFYVDMFNTDLKFIRIVLILCVFFSSAFGVLDYYFVPESFGEFALLRFAIINPLFLIGLISSFFPFFYKINQYVMAFLYFCAGIGIVVMLVLEPENFSYYGGLFLIFAVGHSLTRIRWKLATVTSLLIVLIFILYSFFFNQSHLSTAISYCIFYISFIIIGGYGTYLFDQYRLEKYIQTYTLKGSNVLLEKDNYNNLMEIKRSNSATIYSLARLAELKDSFTGDHIDRVGGLCYHLANELSEEIFLKNNLEKNKFLESIELSSTLHDIGKILINEKILLKPGPLTTEERNIMKEHSNYGHGILLSIRDKYNQNKFINMGLDICKYHHERWDGTGYPDGLSGTEIPLSARIVSIVDVFDALISERPYKKSYTIDVAIIELKKGEGTFFDPELLEVFLKTTK
jgi:hypothetical protein